MRAGEYAATTARLEQLPLNGASRLLVPLLRGWALAGAGDTAAALAEVGTLASTQAFGVVEGIHAGMIADFGGDAAAADAGFARALAGSGENVSLPVIVAHTAYLLGHDRFDEAGALVERAARQNADGLLLEPLVAAVADRRTLAAAVTTPRAGAAEALHGVAALLERERAAGSALLYIQLALALRPDHPRSLFLRGQIQHSLERRDASLASYRAIDTVSPYAWHARLRVAPGT